MKNNVKVKAPAAPPAYPFPGQLDINGAKVPVEVALVTVTGVILKLHTQFIHVGEYCQLNATLPIVNESIFTRTRVLKTYDKAVDPKAHLVERMAELHFDKLSDEHKSVITVFLQAIGQK